MEYRKYGISVRVSGVYKITNNITGEFYVGASVSVASRISNHLNRDARKYKGKHRFYDDILKYGKENFSWELLEECPKENLLEREQYWYDTLKPTYNKERPHEPGKMTDVAKENWLKSCRTPEHKAKMKVIHESAEFKAKCKDIQRKRMKAVVMKALTGEIMGKFESIMDASRWLDEHTEYKGKNKASKIKAVCDGERPSAFGYRWEYKD